MVGGWRLLPTPRSALKSALPETQGQNRGSLESMPCTWPLRQRPREGGPSEGRAWWGRQRQLRHYQSALSRGGSGLWFQAATIVGGYSKKTRQIRRRKRNQPEPQRATALISVAVRGWLRRGVKGVEQRFALPVRGDWVELRSGRPRLVEIDDGQGRRACSPTVAQLCRDVS